MIQHAPPADLDALLETVRDEKTFVDFLQALAADFDMDRTILEATPEAYAYSAGPLGWEHGTISDYLFAAAAWADPAPTDNPWRRCAEILLAGKVYE